MLKFSDLFYADSGRSRSTLLMAFGLVFLEFCYLLIYGAGLLFANGSAGASFNIRLMLMLEFLTRSMWAFFLLSFFMRIRVSTDSKVKRVLVFTWVTALCLALVTAFSLVCLLMSKTFSIAFLAWFRALEIYLQLMWSLSILFLLSSPLFKKKNLSGITNALLPIAQAGAAFYFLQKGVNWLVLISGSARLPFESVRLLWLILVLLVFLGRLAFIRLLVYAPENDCTAEAR